MIVVERKWTGKNERVTTALKGSKEQVRRVKAERIE